MANVPPPAFPFHHRQDVQMRFNDIDILGHVNNTIYFQYMDFGKIQYITEALNDKINIRKESLVIVNISCEFYQITRYDEPLCVLTRVDEIGDSSLTLEQRVVNPQTEDVKTIARTVMVGFNIEKNEKMRIPDHWRRAISAYEGREY